MKRDIGLDVQPECTLYQVATEVAGEKVKNWVTTNVDAVLAVMPDDLPFGFTMMRVGA